MISRNTGRTASRGKAPLRRRGQPLQHRALALRDVERLAPLALVAPDLAHHLGAPVEQRQDLIVDAVDRRAQRREIRLGSGPPGIAQTIIESRPPRDGTSALTRRLLCIALGYGFLTALTPCVYPMIPITLASSAPRRGRRARGRSRWPPPTSRASPLMFGALGTLAWRCPARRSGRSWATRGWSCRWRCSSWRWGCRCSAPSSWRCPQACRSGCRAWAARLRAARS